MPRVSSKEKYIIQTYDLFRKEGLRLNMEQIAAGLNLTKKTLYNNFESKEDLIRTVIRYFFSDVEKKIGESMKSSRNAIEALFLITSVVRDEIDQLGEELLKDMSQYMAERKLLNHTNRMSFYSKLIRENLLRGIKEQLYRTDIDIEYTTLFYTSAIERFYKWDGGSYKFLDDSYKFHSELVKHHLYSVVSNSGRIILESYM
jgi:TetR/AcrR family transcriptional regulator, cholesterol catabolism regulator